MTQRRVTATNQLATVIDVLQLGKKTGILTVERGEGATFEEGTMTFVNGQVVEATIGPYVGRDAATKLFSWQACRFLFIPMPPPAPSVHPDISMHPTSPTLPTLPAMPALPAPRDISTLSTPQTLPDLQAVEKSTTGPLYQIPRPDPIAPGDLSLRPMNVAYAKGSMSEILRTLDEQGLSRTHRRLFLLIDGRRSIKDLAALIRRAPGETLAMLADLEQAGLIQL
jgi:hypothetical protein